MFSGYGGFERLMGLVGTVAFLGVIIALLLVFDGGSGGGTYEPPEEDEDRVLIEAINANTNLGAIEAIINEEPWRVTDERFRGWHPIHVAVGKVCRGEQPHELIDLLLDNGADINAHIEPGWDRERATPLLVAIPHSNVEVVRLLIERGADVTARDRGGQGAHEVTGRLRNERIREEIKELIFGHETQ